MSWILALYRQVANQSVDPIAIPRFAEIINQSMGGSQPLNGTPANWTSLFYNTIMVYPDTFGVLAFVMLTAMPFGMMWITQGNLKIAGILGSIVGLFVFAFLPAGFQAGAIICIIISVVATIWGLFK